MTKHTPGPWHVEDFGDKRLTIFAEDVDETGRPIANIDARRPEAKENAALIASAPELLDVVLRVAGHAKIHAALPVLLLQDIDAVIAKAEGE